MLRSAVLAGAFGEHHERLFIRAEVDIPANGCENLRQRLAQTLRVTIGHLEVRQRPLRRNAGLALFGPD